MPGVKGALRLNSTFLVCPYRTCLLRTVGAEWSPESEAKNMDIIDTSPSTLLSSELTQISKKGIYRGLTITFLFFCYAKEKLQSN